jgi:hypothetical protein
MMGAQSQRSAEISGGANKPVCVIRHRPNLRVLTGGEVERLLGAAV